MRDKQYKNEAFSKSFVPSLSKLYEHCNTHRCPTPKGDTPAGADTPRPHPVRILYQIGQENPQFPSGNERRRKTNQNLSWQMAFADRR
jgi:hypothetical protein